MHLIKCSQVCIVFLLTSALTLFTVIAVATTDQWDVRNAYITVLLALVSFSVLSLNALIFCNPKSAISSTMRIRLCIFIISLYCLAYILATIAYMLTGQVIRIQTLLFVAGLDPLWILIVVLLLTLFVVYHLVRIIKRTISIGDAGQPERKKLQLFHVGSLFLIALVLLANPLYLQIENDLITDETALISVQERSVLSEELSKIKEIRTRPNVVLILLESVSAERLGAYGYPRNVSPNIDSLASKGILFQYAYSTATHSEYAQPGLLSSRYILNSNLRNTFRDDNPRKFIWDIFGQDSYATGYFSSQNDQWQDMNRYLNYSILGTYSDSMSDSAGEYEGGFSWKDYDHNTTTIALSWLNQTVAETKPFFLYLNFQATHDPVSYPEEYSYYLPDNAAKFIGRGEKIINRYDNAIRYMDIQVGRLLAFLDENNLSNDTMIFVTADHGHDLLSRHGSYGHGYTLYEDELLVPTIAYIPGTNHTIVTERVSHIDFVPTLIDLLGYEIPKEFQGETMKKGRPIFFVSQNHKYLIGMIQNDTKIIIDINRELAEAYDLRSDPGENNKLDTAQHENQMLMLLLWRHCQLEYYKHQWWMSPDISRNRCAANNNFKI